MEREVHQLDVDGEIALQLLNTPGTEITPRSNVIGEHLERDAIGHDGDLLEESLIPGGVRKGSACGRCEPSTSSGSP
jgi:hypothetical protein